MYRKLASALQCLLCGYASMALSAAVAIREEIGAFISLSTLQLASITDISFLHSVMCVVGRKSTAMWLLFALLVSQLILSPQTSV